MKEKKEQKDQQSTEEKKSLEFVQASFNISKKTGGLVIKLKGDLAGKAVYLNPGLLKFLMKAG